MSEIFEYALIRVVPRTDRGESINVGLIVYSKAEPVYRSTAQVLVIKKRADVVPIVGGDPVQSFVEDYVSPIRVR